MDDAEEKRPAADLTQAPLLNGGDEVRQAPSELDAAPVKVASGPLKPTPSGPSPKARVVRKVKKERGSAQVIGKSSPPSAPAEQQQAAIIAKQGGVPLGSPRLAEEEPLPQPHDPWEHPEPRPDVEEASLVNREWFVGAEGSGSASTSPLHQAARSGNVDKVEQLLRDAGSREAAVALLCHRNPRGRLPLHVAAWQGHDQVVRILLHKASEYGIEQLDALAPRPQVFRRKDTIRPFHFAILREHPDTLRVFIDEFKDHPNRKEVKSALRASSEVACMVLEATIEVVVEDAQSEKHAVAYQCQDPRTIFINGLDVQTGPDDRKVVTIPDQEQSMRDTVILDRKSKVHGLDEASSCCLIKWIAQTGIFDLVHGDKKKRFFEPRWISRIGVEKGPYELYAMKRPADEELLSLSIMRALSHARSSSACGTLAARCLVSAAWDEVFPCYLFDIVLNFISLLLLMVVTWEMHHNPDPPIYSAFLMIFVCIKDLTGEMFQLKDGGFHYFLVWSNYLDWLRILLEIGCILYCIFWTGNFEGSVVNPVVAIWVAWRWMRVLWCMRGLRLIGIRIMPILSTIFDITGFALLMVFTLAASIHGYLTLGLHGPSLHGNKVSPVVDLILRARIIYRLAVLGDFDLKELEGRANPDTPDMGENWRAYHLAVVFFFFVVSAFVTVMLMNLFIGVLGTNFAKYEALSEEIFIQTRAGIIVDYLAQPHFGPWIQLPMEKDTFMVALVKPEGSLPDQVESVAAHVNRLAEEMRQVVDNNHQVVRRMERLEDMQISLQRMETMLLSMRR